MFRPGSPAARMTGLRVKDLTMKMTCRRSWIGFSLAAVALVAHGAQEPTYAVVDSVQMPAWVERDGQRAPLEPGKLLRNRDRVITGEEARVVIAMGEGSAVRLGENAQLELNALGRRENRVFTAALDVARGAFRLTTGVFSRRPHARAFNVRVATITAGIRGTDLWGSSDATRDLVCLLEGRITVLHPLDEAREMSDPLSFYVAPKGLAPKPIDRVDASQVEVWAAQTAIQDGSGYARRGGQWNLELALAETPEEALALYDRARAAGYAVRVKPLKNEGGDFRYSIRVRNLASKVEAVMLSGKVAGVLGLESPRVLRH